MVERTLNNKLKNELKLLTHELESLSRIDSLSFNTIEEFEKYKNQNLTDFKRYSKIKQRISEIEFQLLSDEKKNDRINYLKKLRDKFSK